MEPERSPLARVEEVYRHSVFTRVAHWTWAVCLFFLLLSGLQIFNAHPTLYVGEESGFQYENAVLRIHAVETPEGEKGRVSILGHDFDTTGVFGLSGSGDHQQRRAFPASLTIPSYRDLGTGRVVHFFFGWLFVVALTLWLVGSLSSGHLRRNLVITKADLANLPRDIVDHARLRFHHARHYGVLQKLAYAGVLFVLFPLMIATGLTMSPGANAALPWLLDLFGGRQTARTLHFVAMILLLLFFVVHIAMVLLAGPVNELRSMITGWYRADADGDGK